MNNEYYLLIFGIDKEKEKDPEIRFLLDKELLDLDKLILVGLPEESIVKGLIRDRLDLGDKVFMGYLITSLEQPEIIKKELNNYVEFVKSKLDKMNIKLKFAYELLSKKYLDEEKFSNALERLEYKINLANEVGRYAVL